MGTSKNNKKGYNYTNVSNIHKYNNFLKILDKKSEETDKNMFNNNKISCDCKHDTNNPQPDLKSSFFTGTRSDDFLSLQLEKRKPDNYLEITNKNKKPKLSLKIPTNGFF